MAVDRTKTLRVDGTGDGPERSHALGVVDGIGDNNATNALHIDGTGIGTNELHASREVRLHAEGMKIFGVAFVDRDIVGFSFLPWPPATGCFKCVGIDLGFGKCQILVTVGKNLIVVGKSERRFARYCDCCSTTK